MRARFCWQRWCGIKYRVQGLSENRSAYELREHELRRQLLPSATIPSTKLNSSEVQFFRQPHWRHAMRFNRRYRRSGHIWQNRYYSSPLGPSHLAAALAYVDLNPVRAGLVGDAVEYPWSSARAHLEGSDQLGLLDDWAWPGAQRSILRSVRPASNSRSCSSEAGLTRCRSNPACMMRWRSFSCPQPVSATKIMSLPQLWLRMCPAAS